MHGFWYHILVSFMVAHKQRYTWSVGIERTTSIYCVFVACGGDSDQSRTTGTSAVRWIYNYILKNTRILVASCNLVVVRSLLRF